MSIETLLEAAKFLELQALNQQKTREENELRETIRLEQEAGKRRAEVASYVQRTRASHVTSAEGSSVSHRHASVPGLALSPPPTPLSAHPIPIAVIPIPAVSTNSALMPTTLNSPPSARLTPPRKEAHSAPAHHALHPSPLLSNQAKAAPPTSPGQSSGAQQSQPYLGSIVAAPQHALLPQAGPPPAQPIPAAKTSPLDETRGLDSKKRPGGAGTREVHNKLEKNRRAHLKECFETLKKNIPNVDEKKTSNLSVLRSALRHIQTLKRREKEYEHEMERLAREKISMQQRLAELKNELGQWMDVMDMDRVLHQTVQPEDDQVSTSTASEGEDNVNEDVEQEALNVPGSQPKAPHVLLPESRKPQLPPHVSIPPDPSQPPLPPAHAVQPAPASAPAQPPSASVSPTPAQAPAAPLLHPQAVAAPPSLPPPGHVHVGLQPSVIAHAAASHASVIQAVNHVVPAGAKHMAHIAPSPSGQAQLAHGPQPIGHIAVHPVAHLGQPLPTLYSQPVTMTQPGVMSHVSHVLSHGASTPSSQAAALVAKQASQVVAHHPQLVGQTVLNPVTMVTMPSFPVSTLKLA